MADQMGAVSVAFPAISTGIYGYPREEAAAIVDATLRQALERLAAITEIRLVFFSQDDAKVFLKNKLGSYPH